MKKKTHSSQDQKSTISCRKVLQYAGDEHDQIQIQILCCTFISLIFVRHHFAFIYFFLFFSFANFVMSSSSRHRHPYSEQLLAQTHVPTHTHTLFWLLCHCACAFCASRPKTITCHNIEQKHGRTKIVKFVYPNKQRYIARACSE